MRRRMSGGGWWRGGLVSIVVVEGEGMRRRGWRKKIEKCAGWPEKAEPAENKI